MDDDGSLFEELMLEAVDPITVRVSGQEWLVDVPAADEVAALDDCVDAEDVLDELLGDLADPILDALGLGDDEGDGASWAAAVGLAADLRDHFALSMPPPGGWASLVWRIDRFGADIAWDLRRYLTLDLADWFRGERPWPELFRHLERMPSGSRYTAGLLLDPELAERELEREADRGDEDDDEKKSSNRPPLVGETYDRQLLRSVVSMLRRIEHATYAVHAGKGKAGKPPPPLAGPVTAREALLDERGDEDVYEIFAAVDAEWRHPDNVGQDAAPSGFAERESGLWAPSKD